ncbi:MAG: N-acetylmuramoyl-L-alanine amidase [Candidatus Saelkia tenebricola]|nr:N-acetylmuramoyl-L-alanine amidase [Candidatus Saelkia tenebricola]
MKSKILILFLVFNIGCASIPVQKRAGYVERISRKDLSLNEFARKYDFQVDFDPFLKKIYLSKGDDVQIVCAFESPVAIVNGHTILLESDLKINNGNPQFSSQNIERLLNYLFYGRVESKAVKRKGPGEIYRIKRIVLDPGHGGRDPGAIGKSGVKEKDLVLSLAKILQSKLKRAGYEVSMTREDDKFVSLWQRVAFANKEGADLFISIHVNSARQKSASGFEVFYLSQTSDEESRALASAENYPLGFEDGSSYDLNVQATIWDLLYSENRKDAVRLAEKICLSMDEIVGLRNRGVKSANFYVLRGAQMPAVLVEAGFISNKFEEENLKQWRFKNKIAEAIAEGVRSYEKAYVLTEGFKR